MEGGGDPGGGWVVWDPQPLSWYLQRLDRRLEEVAKAVGGGYCRLQMPLKRALAVRETVAGHWLDALDGAIMIPLQQFECH